METSSESAARGFVIAVVIGLGYVLLYSVFDIDLARSLHQRWSLALAAATPVLVGWAIAMRYGVYLPLFVGFAYGFLQPAAFEAVFPSKEYVSAQTELLAKALVVLAILKVAWALVIGRYMMSRPKNEKPIVPVQAEASELNFITKAPKRFIVYAALLAAGLSVCYFLTTPVNLTWFALLVGTISGSIAIVDGLLRFRQKQKPQSARPPSPSSDTPAPGD